MTEVSERSAIDLMVVCCRDGGVSRVRRKKTGIPRVRAPGNG